MSSTTVTRGNSHETFYIAPSLTPAQVGPNTVSTQTFSLPGLQITDYIQSGGYIANQTTGAFIVEADCLTVQFGNVLTASVTPAAGVYEFQITRLEGSAPTTAV